jgi:FecR protein
MLARLPAGHFFYRDIGGSIPVRKTNCLPVLSIFAAALVLCCSVPGLAQRNRDRHVISAKAGGINAITGQATVRAKSDSDWQQLMVTDDLNAGDRVRTGYDGRIEILLNPGSYLRVGGDSEVELSDNTLANLELRLTKGTAVVEATGVDGVELNINISTPHTRIAIVRHGLYRVSVVPGNATELVVRKGRVVLSDSQTKVKGGNKVVFSQTKVSVAKMTKEEKKREDTIDAWGKERAELLAKANRRINDRMLATAFANRDPFADWRFARGFGLWFYNSFAGCYTFIPWYYGWRSPYGGHYTTGAYNPYAWQPGRNGTTGNPSGGSNGSGGSTPPATGSNGNGGGGHSYPSGGGSAPRPVSPSGGFGGNGTSQPAPSPRIDSDTGRPMPRKSLEPSRP